MFTGIIEHMGRVKELRRAGEGSLLVLELGAMTKEVKPGESISVEGVCLTVTGLKGEQASFDVSQETLKRSTLGELRVGQGVNLERSLKVGERMGGHFVQGHVDGTGTIQKKEEHPGQCTMWFTVSKELAENMIEKGSVAVDGISLTVVEVKDTSFSVALIPFTLTNTTLGLKKVGDRANIEADILGKWVKRLYGTMLAPNQGGSGLAEKGGPAPGKEQGGITMEFLKDKGFE
ncbi:MAG TPA: riboflavin synthase [Candidatus Tripitaka californicus]|uniref:riboflavin synthase n=1 Tax=Candidatus Tripitaka californicus TaxID=3367616 RepID=UPI00402702D5|nr:riboflavin synthase [Planctomycetota bacterium]